MEFYYPNFINDMWRIMGLVFFGDKTHFLLDSKHFDKQRITSFLSERGIGVADSVSSAVRLKDNASDNFLRVIERTDIIAILRSVPQCETIITAGEKSTNEALASLNSSELAKGLRLGESVKITLSELGSRQIELFRLPSSSRAYPLQLEAKAQFYAKVFKQRGLEVKIISQA
ncbi:DNA glycosylase [Campylobacter sp. 19-13652]|nr:DNA glycosylase [Campylobacter sp. 19-13652]